MLWVVALKGIVGSEAGVGLRETYEQGVKTVFAENVGQLPESILFYSLHPTVAYVFEDGRIHIGDVSLRVGSPRFIVSDMPARTRISYFGKGKGIKGIPTYRRIVLKEAYPDIDAVLTADENGRFEIQFVVYPGGDPTKIALETDADVEVREDGLYIVKNGREIVKLSDLKAYQGAEEINVRPVLSRGTIRFEVKGYDTRYTLVIDPVVTAIVASSMGDAANAVAVDNDGNVFLAGYTLNYSDFSESRNVFGSFSGYQDAFVVKLSPDLTTHISTAIIMSDQWDEVFGLAVDNTGYVYVVGWTGDATNFSVSRIIHGSPNNYDAFITKLSDDLSTHEATAIIASTGADAALDVVVNAGYVYVVGSAGYYLDFPGSGPRFGSSVGSKEVFVAKLTSDLATLTARVLLTSDSADYGRAIALDPSGDIIVAGYTGNATDFSATSSIFGTPGGYDAFVTKLSLDLSTHLGTAIIASPSRDEAHGVASAPTPSGEIFVVGWTYDPDNFSTGRTVFGSSGGFTDAFITRLSNDLTTHEATAILTSSGSDEAHDVAVSSSGEVYVVGMAYNSSDFSQDRTVYGSSGYKDAFLTKLSGDISSHMATAILASSMDDYAYALAISPSGEVLVAGRTNNYADFSLNRTVFGTTSLDDEAFVVKVPAAVSVDEKPEREAISVDVFRNVLRISFTSPSYVGYDVYSADGRLVKRVSLGYLPAGRYEYRFDLPKGAYLLKVRVGDEVMKIKGIM